MTVYLYYVAIWSAWVGVIAGFCGILLLTLLIPATFDRAFPRRWVLPVRIAWPPLFLLGGPALVVALHALPGGH